MTQNKGYYAVRGHSSLTMPVLVIAHMRLLIGD